MNKTAKRLMAVVITACLLVSTVFAASSLPKIPSSDLVIDEAGVLSAQTEKTINNLSADLGAACGAQIAVATVDYTGQSNIDDYAYDLFDEWGIGDKKKNNGVLLLLAINDEDYFCTIGTGLEKKLTPSRIDDLLYDNLEDGFASGNYDAGVTKFVNAVYDELCDIYDVSPQGTAPGNQGGNQGGNNSGGGFLDKTFETIQFFGVLIGMIVLIVLIVVINSIFHPVRRVRTRYFGYHYTPRPPRPRRHHHHHHHGGHHHRSPPPPPRHHHGGGMFGGGPRPGGGMFSSGPRPGGGRPSSGGSSFGGGRSSGSGSGRSSGGSGRSSSPRAGGGSSRGAGSGRRR